MPSALVSSASVYRWHLSKMLGLVGGAGAVDRDGSGVGRDPASIEIVPAGKAAKVTRILHGPECQTKGSPVAAGYHRVFPARAPSRVPSDGLVGAASALPAP